MLFHLIRDKSIIVQVTPYAITLQGDLRCLYDIEVESYTGICEQHETKHKTNEQSVSSFIPADSVLCYLLLHVV